MVIRSRSLSKDRQYNDQKVAAQGVANKNLSLGDMIMIQALLLQLFIPLGSLGIEIII
jgi:ABC-type transport system involved in Fe-S cluster assembly fused permease/ATPase subunit